jgi:hypothetical protein
MDQVESNCKTNHKVDYEKWEKNIYMNMYLVLVICNNNIVLEKDVVSELDRTLYQWKHYQWNRRIQLFKARRWNMISHILRHENELIYRIIEEKIEGKADRGHPRT